LREVVVRTPESVAAALAYVSAQMSLLWDFTDHARRARSGEPLAIINLRRSIEGDRFGLVAQVLTVRDGCIRMIAWPFIAARSQPDWRQSCGWGF